MTTPTFSEVQARADEASRALGRAPAPRPLAGESELEYERRMLSYVQPLSARWKCVDLSTASPDVLRIAADAIYNDAAAEAANPEMTLRPNELREVKSADAAGRYISRFYGNPEITWAPFKSVGRRVIGFGGR